MKLYKPPPPPDLMRINIKKQGYKTEHIAVEQTTQQELIAWLKDLIAKQGLSIFETGKITTVEVRESIAGKNGKSESFHFKGLDPSTVATLILRQLMNK